MNTSTSLNPAKAEIQRTRNAIRRSWSPGQRALRQRLAAARQQWLVNVLPTRGATVPARVA